MLTRMQKLQYSKLKYAMGLRTNFVQHCNVLCRSIYVVFAVNSGQNRLYITTRYLAKILSQLHGSEAEGPLASYPRSAVPLIVISNTAILCSNTSNQLLSRNLIYHYTNLLYIASGKKLSLYRKMIPDNKYMKANRFKRANENYASNLQYSRAFALFKLLSSRLLKLFKYTGQPHSKIHAQITRNHA